MSHLDIPISGDSPLQMNQDGYIFPIKEKADKAFEKIKRHLSLPIISCPDFTQHFTLTTDTSDIAYGAILMQEADNR